MRRGNRFGARFAGSALLVVAALGLHCLDAPRVRACGGLFCSTSPVDQTTERIVFGVNDDGTVTAIVQISYRGERDDFAWIVPVADTPELDVFPAAALSMLDGATAPRYRIPCANPLGAAGVDTDVTVLAREQVGPYDTVTVRGSSAMELVGWLQDNGYRITEAMVPHVQRYVDEGMAFLAMRLAAEAEVSDIQPLVMTYEGRTPVIPIRLTAVAAEPEMGILVWVLGEGRYQPENYVSLPPPALEEVPMVGFVSSYRARVSALVDAAFGQAFVTEYAGPTDALAATIADAPAPAFDADGEGREALLALLARYPHVTRMYTRMSAEEMTRDPRFEPVADDVGAEAIDLTVLPPGASTSCPAAADPCEAAYCGRQGVCVRQPEQSMPACICGDDATARVTTTGPGGFPLIYCEPLAQNLSAPGDDAGCAGVDCGAGGSCVSVNGSPTCLCPKGTAAVPSPLGSLSALPQCVAYDGPIPDFPLLPPIGGQLDEPAEEDTVVMTRPIAPTSPTGAPGTAGAGSSGDTELPAAPAMTPPTASGAGSEPTSTDAMPTQRNDTGLCRAAPGSGRGSGAWVLLALGALLVLRRRGGAHDGRRLGIGT